MPINSQTTPIKHINIQNTKMKNKSLHIFFSILIISFSDCKKKNYKAATIQTKESITVEKEEHKSPAEDAFVSQTQNDELAEKIKNYITKNYLSEADLRAINASDKKFQLYQIDLNNDGKQEVFVNFMTPYFCGTGGCTLLLLDDKMKLINKFTVTRTPIFAKNTMINDWKVLLTRSQGDLKKLVYSNGTYPTNPSMVEETVEKPGNDAEIIFDEAKSAKTYSF